VNKKQAKTDLKEIRDRKIVRMYGFKLEGGEWFKEGFRKILSLE